MPGQSLPQPEKLAAIQQLLLAWFEQSGRDLPWRRTRDPYRILVSEVMLQQTQVERVRLKYEEFLARFPTLQELAAAPVAEVIRAWQGLGYNRRAVNLQRAARAVLDQHGGRFPSEPDELRRLPGIGAYTAGAVACFAFERDVAFLDTNIRRVTRRLFCGPDERETPPEAQLQQIAQAAVPAGRGWSWNQAIMELGALICTAASPACQRCPLRSHCATYRARVEADAAIFTQPLQPQQSKTRRALRERQPFTSSSRYFRGRIVDVLRGLAPGQAIALNQLGPRINAEFEEADLPWLARLVDGLADDGLAEWRERQAVQLADWLVALPA